MIGILIEIIKSYSIQIFKRNWMAKIELSNRKFPLSFGTLRINITSGSWGGGGSTCNEKDDALNQTEGMSWYCTYSFSINSSYTCKELPRTKNAIDSVETYTQKNCTCGVTTQLDLDVMILTANCIHT